MIDHSPHRNLRPVPKQDTLNSPATEVQTYRISAEEAAAIPYKPPRDSYGRLIRRPVILRPWGGDSA
ncbi:hypothetical protein WMW72_10730 [Paenibacillus filicis]|uniref:Uncharacterized protein n=1 Tax=Paenibacillus filicis TaxID=669464 RepID=A0ABU9DHL9_9BACL